MSDFWLATLWLVVYLVKGLPLIGAYYFGRWAQRRDTVRKTGRQHIVSYELITRDRTR